MAWSSLCLTSHSPYSRAVHGLRPDSLTSQQRHHPRSQVSRAVCLPEPRMRAQTARSAPNKGLRGFARDRDCEGRVTDCVELVSVDLTQFCVTPAPVSRPGAASPLHASAGVRVCEDLHSSRSTNLSSTATSSPNHGLLRLHSQVSSALGALAHSAPLPLTAVYTDGASRFLDPLMC